MSHLTIIKNGKKSFSSALGLGKVKDKHKVCSMVCCDIQMQPLSLLPSTLIMKKWKQGDVIIYKCTVLNKMFK